METLFQTYKDIAEFRLIYIKEAHAIGDSGPVEYAREKGIKQHKTIEQRCSTAQRLMSDKELTIPTLIDRMDNAASEAYAAHPDRVFLIRKDGRIGVSGAPGARGFEPGLQLVEKWLEQYKKNGKEPPLPKTASKAAQSGKTGE